MITIQTLIVVALSSEWPILRRRYRFTKPLPDLPLFIYHTQNKSCANAKNNDFKVAVLQIGMGSEKAKSTLQQFFKTHQAQHIFHFGLSGALGADLPVESLFLPSQICNHNGQTVAVTLPSAISINRQPTGDLTPRASANNIRSIRASNLTGRLLTVSMPLVTVVEKKMAAKATGAIAVDMESFAVATFCHEQKVSYTSCRGIIDSHNEAITVFANTQTPTGHTRFWRLAANILRQPTAISLLLKFAKRHARLQKYFLECVQDYFD